MRTLFTVPFLLCALPLFAANERDLFYEALDHKDFGKMERALKNWEKGHSEDAEVLLARGLYFQAKAQKGKIKLLPNLPREETLLIHPSQWSVEPPGVSTRLDPKLSQKAGRYWRRAVQLYPWRLDIYFKLAELYQELDDFDSQNGILGQALLYGEKKRHRLKWEDDGELPSPYKKCASERIESTIEGYFEAHRHEEDVKALRLSKLLITFFPSDPYGYNFIAAYFSTQPDWPYTLKYLMLAYQKDPENSLVLNNLGSTLLKLGKKKEARVFFKKVISLDQDEALVQFAKERLE